MNMSDFLAGLAHPVTGADHILAMVAIGLWGVVAGGFPAAQYVADIVTVDGIKLPTRRRAYIRAPDLKPIRDLLMVAIDLNNFRFERRLAGEK